MAKQNKGRKFFAASATAALVASAIVPVASAAQVNDYNKISGYAKEAVQSLVDKGVIQGDTNGNFNPLNTVTRAQAAEIFTKALELEADGDVNFSDVKKGAWYYNSIAAVVANGIFEGVSANEFAPNKSLTRSEAAKVLVDAFGLEGEADLSQFADASQVKGWAKESLEIAVANGIFEGSDTKKLNPNGAITRQDFAVVFNRTLNLGDTETPVDAAIKAINNTTVEVTFDAEVDNVQALDFKIDGLEIKNASVKQTNKKVVVLSTAAQEAGKDYTVTLDGEKVGSFKGIAAVNPTKVELVSTAVQGKLGQEVKVQAKVTVAEGQSKAGIPVTFNVPGNNNDGVQPTLTGEALTNEEGIATYSYTRYKDVTDEVTAYATGDRSKFSLGYVFWGVDTILSVEEVTTGGTINNGANKTYKVTYKNPKTGKVESGRTFNVGFIENMNVTSDKVANATVNGVAVKQLNNNSTAPLAAQVTTDSKGEATFTVSGTNAEVTPVIFAVNTTTNESANLYKTSALQATASKVKFAAVQADYTIEVARDGGEVAAIYADNGREYKITVKDKDGKLAKNEVVNVAFNEDLDRVISTVTDAKFIDADNSVYYPNSGTGNTAKQISVKTNDKGEATFVIGSDRVDDYATPVAWIDINTSNAKEATLDEGEPKAVAPISYFQRAYLDGASVKSYDAAGKKQTKFEDTQVATFKAELVNQSNSVISATTKSVSYTVFNTGSNDIDVAGRTVSPNRSITLSYPRELASADLQVKLVDPSKSSSVRVIATGVAINPADSKDFAFTAKEVTATFTATADVTNNYIGRVASVNTADKTLTFAGKKAISYKDAKFVAENNASLEDADAFIAELKKYTTNAAEVQYSKDADGKVTFKIVRTATSGGPTIFDEFSSVLTKAVETVVGKVGKYATATIDTAVIDAADNNTLEVGGVKFTRYTTGTVTPESNFYSSLNDLAFKINNRVTGVTATVNGSVLELKAVKNGTFDYVVNGTKLTSEAGELGQEQQVTFTFSEALNIANGDKVTVNNTTVGTVAAVKDSKKTVVVNFGSPGITGAVTKFTVDDAAKKNTVTIDPKGVTVTK